MPGNIAMERQYQVLGPDGTVYWHGTALIGVDFIITATAATIRQQGAVIVDSTTVLGRADNPGTSDAVYATLVGKEVASAASVGFLGVAYEAIAASATGRIAGPGSIIAVKCTSGAIAAGADIGGSGTAGLTASIAGTTNGTVLGICIVAASQQGALGVYEAGCLVMPK